ncbi:uncharacterized protein LOC122198757 isoform X3 [Panthera leo]|uniref:uncharacterized protein LOC122198757 isoform X3 n=1 Tax=Panthera leo TaxID=9689 RepID=UPI001C6A0557|nr:uncharacterized protein LOC122198757 isoform X3 [Panthera leo]
MWVNITCNPGTYINERGVRSRRTHIKQQWLRQSNRIREFQEYSIVIQHSYTLLSAYRVSFYMRSQRRSCWCGSYIYVSSPVSSLQMKHHNLGYASKEYRTRQYKEVGYKSAKTKPNKNQKAKRTNQQTKNQGLPGAPCSE